MSFKTIKPSFAGGELSPALAARVDLSKYHVGARELKNCFVHPHGGASNRAGTEFVAEAKYPDKPVKMLDLFFHASKATRWNLETATSGFIRKGCSSWWKLASRMRYLLFIRWKIYRTLTPRNPQTISILRVGISRRCSWCAEGISRGN